MAIPRGFIQDLHDKLEIEDVISSYIDLKRAGRNTKGLCPFHNEKTPSFTVYPETKSFYCFGCGASGDVISFVMRIENLDYVEAVKACAEKAGMTMPEDGYDDSLSKLRMRILSANREAAKFYNSILYTEKGKVGLEYYQKRRLSKKMITHFGLGYAPDEWQALSDHLKSLGYNENELIQANLARRSQKTGRIYDNFRNRIIFPIMDLRGNVIAFSARRINEQDAQKYINTSDTPVFKKGDGIFGLNFAKNSNTRQLILAEGQMDAIAFHEFGFTNAVATLGTALTKEQANLMARYADEILICYDNDEAGRKATARALSIFGETGLKVKVITLEGGKDADEILRTYGPERVNAAINRSENEVEYKLRKELDNYNTFTDDGKVKYLSVAAQILATCSPLEQEIYSTRLSNEFKIKKESIDVQIKSAGRRVSKQRNEERKKADRAKMMGSFEDKNNPERAKNLKAARAEETLISSLMRNPEYYGKLKDSFSPEDFATEFNRRLITELISLIEGGYSTDLSMFNGAFSPKEMDTVSRIAMKQSELANTLKECEDCIRVLKENKEKMSSEQIGNLSDEEFRNLINSIGGHKNGS